MTNLVRIDGRYYFNRRVPEFVREYDTRKLIRVGLRTDSKAIAKRRAVMFNDQLEDYWRGLIKKGERHDSIKFKAAVLTAQQMGFCYQPMNAVAALPIGDLVARILALQGASTIQVEALLGGHEKPEILLSDALKRFWDYAKDKTIGKSEFQITKWKNPRRKAVENFIALVGDKDICKVTRDDILKFRDWWIERIKTNKKAPDSANKNLLHLRMVMQTVADNMNLKIDCDVLFKKILLKAPSRRTRKPFTKEQILNILTSPELEYTHVEIRNFLCIMAETGARPHELVALREDDIVLDADIPHISIVDRGEDESLKTEQSARTIPLVGYALDALKAMPQGFSHYRNKSDILTTATNKFLRSKNLLPSKNHTAYSLRHSFQDRLLNAKAPDRVQTDLMGHKFERPDYGDGSSLENKRYWMKQVALGTAVKNQLRS